MTLTSERADSKLPSKAFTNALNTLKQLKVERTVIAIRTKQTTYKKKDQSVFARRLATNRQYFASVTKRALRYLAYLLPRGEIHILFIFSGVFLKKNFYLILQKT